MSGTLPPEGLRILAAPLGRVRAMLYRYYELFFRFTGAGLVVVGAQRGIEGILAEAYEPATEPEVA